MWTVCQTQYAHKDTESETCRLYVYSFFSVFYSCFLSFLSILSFCVGFSQFSKFSQFRFSQFSKFSQFPSAGFLSFLSFLYIKWGDDHGCLSQKNPFKWSIYTGQMNFFNQIVYDLSLKYCNFSNLTRLLQNISCQLRNYTEYNPGGITPMKK